MKAALYVLSAVFVAYQGTPARKAPSTTESVNVSAGVSRQQLALEAKLNEVLAQGDLAKRAGDIPAEIQSFEMARDMVRKDKLLAEQEDRVLWKLAGAYLNGKKPTEAASTYEVVLDLRRPHCDGKEGLVSDCASAQQMIGVAKIQGGDFDGALVDLRKVEPGYEIAASHSPSEESRMVSIKDQAQLGCCCPPRCFVRADGTTQ